MIMRVLYYLSNFSCLRQNLGSVWNMHLMTSKIQPEIFLVSNIIKSCAFFFFLFIVGEYYIPKILFAPNEVINFKLDQKKFPNKKKIPLIPYERSITGPVAQSAGFQREGPYRRPRNQKVLKKLAWAMTSKIHVNAKR